MGDTMSIDAIQEITDPRKADIPLSELIERELRLNMARVRAA